MSARIIPSFPDCGKTHFTNVNPRASNKKNMEKTIKFNYPEYTNPELEEEPKVYILHDGEHFNVCKLYMSGSVPLFCKYSIFGADTLNYGYNMKWIDFEEGKKHFHSFDGMSKEQVIEFMWKLEGGDMSLGDYTAKVTFDKFECEGGNDRIFVEETISNYRHITTLEYFLATFEEWENPILIDLNKGDWKPYITEVPCQ